MLSVPISSRELVIWMLVGWVCFRPPPTFAHGQAQLEDLLTWFVGDRLDHIDGCVWVDGEEFSGSVTCSLDNDKKGVCVAWVTTQGPDFVCDFYPDVEKTEFATIRIHGSWKVGQKACFTWKVPQYPVGNTEKKSCSCSGAEGVPTLTEWGLIALGMLLAGSLAWMIRRKIAHRPAGA